MNQSERRSRIAYQVALQRVGDYGFRAAMTRLGALVVLAVTLGFSSPPWFVWLILAFALFSTYLSVSDNYYTDKPEDVTPINPIAAKSLAYSNRTLGLNRPNIPGILEAVSYVPLGILGPWLLADQPSAVRLVCVAASLVYVGSCLGAVFGDPAFYNPDVRMPTFIEGVRASVGLLSAGIAAAVILPAPWSSDARWAALALCAALLAVQIRLRETDRAFVLARAFSDNEQIVGRQAITASLHSRVGAPLDALARYITRNKDADPDLHDQYRLLVGGYREVLEQDSEADLDIEWPGVLAGQLQQLLGSRGIDMTFTHPEDPLSRWDRYTATLVLADFAQNAVKANATACTVSLGFDANTMVYTATSIDNGDPINADAWMREGGGLVRLDARLRERGGRISYRTLDDGWKEVTGHWQSSKD